MKIYRQATYSDEIDKKWSEWIDTTQNENPDAPDFAVDLRRRGRSIPASIRSDINSRINALGSFHEQIPLSEIFNILKEKGIIVLQEDGTLWSGFVTSQGECGSEKANNQGPMQFNLARLTEKGYVFAPNYLIMTVCTMPSGKLEIVAYVS